MERCAKSVCEPLKYINPLERVSVMLVHDDEILATGQASIETEREYGIFWPSAQTLLAVPNRQIFLRISGRSEAIPIESFRLCHTPRSILHYHFRVHSRLLARTLAL